MYVKLKPITHEFNNCFQGQVQTIVEGYYHKNYLLTQIYRWSTTIDVVDGSIKNVSQKDFLNTDELVLLGLKKEEIQCSDKQDTIQKIKEELNKKMPVIIAIQIANCPWDLNYRTEFVMEHFIIINGFSEKQASFICCDATYNKQDVLLPIVEYVEGATNEYWKIVEFDKTKQLSEENVKRLLEYKARDLISRKDDHFQKLVRIGDYLIDNADALKVKEEQLDNALFSRSYMIIRDCAKAREMLAFILKENKDVKMRILSELFDLCMKKWLKIRILYVHAATSVDARQHLTKMGKYIYKIKELEERIANYIVYDDKNLIEEYLSNEKNNIHFIKRSFGMKQQHIIDLKPFYNNKAFGKLENHEVAKFTSLGEYMVTTSDTFRYFINDGTEVLLDVSDSLDNVICRNQRIPVHLKKVVELFVLGNNELCTEDEKIILEMESGRKEVYQLDFPEWYTEIMSDDMPVIQQRVAIRKYGQVKMTSFTGKIFLKRIVVPALDIDFIRLPKIGGIHVFQIVAYTTE